MTTIKAGSCDALLADGSLRPGSQTHLLLSLRLPKALRRSNDAKYVFRTAKDACEGHPLESLMLTADSWLSFTAMTWDRFGLVSR